MSKRTSSEMKPMIKSNKKIKTDSSQSQSGDYDPDEDETEAEVTVVHQTPGRMDMDESLMDIDEHDSEEFKAKLNSIINLETNEKKINGTIRLFKETINVENSKKLNSLFYILVEYLSLNSLNLDDKFVSQISSLLTLQIDSLSLDVLKKIVNLFIGQIREAKPFNEKMISLFVEIFKFLQKIQAAESEKKKTFSFQVPNKNETISAKIDALIASKFNEKTALNVLSIFKYVSLNPIQTKNLLSNVLNTKEITWSNGRLPVLIESVLYFSHMKANRTMTFEKILEFFYEINKIDANTQKNDFIECERLAIVHLIHLIKSDSESSKDLLKILKNMFNSSLIELVKPFTFSLTLALVKAMPTGQEAVIELLKQVIFKIFDTEMKFDQYYWINKSLDNQLKEVSKFLLKPSTCRLLAQEPVLAGLIEFLFELIDAYGVRITKTIKPTTLKEKITKYGSDILRDLFRNVAGSRGDILDKITERILSSKIEKSIVFVDQLSILILSEPASSFQDYFGKFKGRLEQMIYMIPVVALEFLNCIKPLLKYDSIYKDNLIAQLKKSIYQSDLNIRRVGLNGLIYLLNSTKLSSFLPSSQASQSMTLSQSQSQISRVNMSQEKCAEKNCLEIFLGLRRCLSQQSQIRSKLYQSCPCLVSQNPTLIGPTLNLLLINLENYLLKVGHDLLIDFSKCVKIVSGSNKNELETLEPIDILLHSLDLCNSKYIKMEMQGKFQEQMDEDIKRHSDLIVTYFDQLKQNLILNNESHILDTYKSQVMSVLIREAKSNNILQPVKSTTQKPQTQRATQKATQKPAENANNIFEPASLTPFYQSFLGTIEVLIEHYLNMASIDSIKELTQKFNKMHDLINNIYAGKTNAPPVKQPAAGKKKKANSKTQKEKENKEPGSMTMIDLTQMDDDENENEHKVAKTEANPAKNSAAKKTSSSSSSSQAVKFNYTHRLSYTTTLRLLQLYFCKENKFENDFDQPVDEVVENLKSDDNFHVYLTKVVDQQLQMLLDEAKHLKVNAVSDQIVYDCESYSEKQLFEYLYQIWIIFWKEMSVMQCDSGCDETSFCDFCISDKTAYAKILNNVWKIGSTRFNAKLDQFFSYSIFEDENSRNSSNDTTNNTSTSTIAVGILDQCRSLVNKCSQSRGAQKVKSMKLASSLVEFMNDVSNSIGSNLNNSDLSVLFNWCQTFFTVEENDDPMLIKSIFQYFMFITWKKNSSGALIKYVFNDICFMIESKNCSLNGSLGSKSQKYFSCLNESNTSAIINLSCEELLNIIGLFEWLIHFKYEQKTVASYHKQMSFVLESIRSLLSIEIHTNNVTNLLIKILVKFYNFMIAYCKDVSLKATSNEDLQSEIKCLKVAIDYTGLQLQKPLDDFINLIQNAKSSLSSKKNQSKAEAARNAKLNKYAKVVPNLVYLIEQFKLQLPMLNKCFQKKFNVDFTEHFKLCMRDFKINLDLKRPEELTQASSTLADMDNDEASRVKKESDSEEVESSEDEGVDD